MKYRLGIDVGGTNTDAALLDSNLAVVSTVKTPTEDNAGLSVEQAISNVLDSSGISPSSIKTAMLGTTHCTNAIVERRGLSRVGVLRIGAPATTAVPPFEGWPESLKDAVAGPTAFIQGGHEFNGREIQPLDTQSLETACRSMVGKVDAIAIVSVFSPVTSAHEQRAAKLAAEITGVPVSLSNEIGSVGLLERENATILNAALIRTLHNMASGFQRSLEDHGIHADVYFGQNDGTVMRLDFALRYPVLTIGCGPTNSLRGAAHLSGESNALVIDIGGTTTDIGVLVDGSPRQSSKAKSIGGIRTNFRMPDILSVGLGGGTRVHVTPQEYDTGDPSTSHHTPAAVHLGPDSVGYRLTREALSFGGTTLTATDIAVKAGRLSLDSHTSPSVEPEIQAAAELKIREILEENLDQMKPNAQDIPLILVGGGADISPSSLHGVSKVIRPEHSGAANAVGAAIGEVAGQVERIFSLDEVTKADAIHEARSDAVNQALAAGASSETIEILSLEDLPVAYMDRAVLVRARAAGQLTDI
jgi:N-methylhydantoinase A/oxoprolinase/acetone carboxylase beta subunit